MSKSLKDIRFGVVAALAAGAFATGTAHASSPVVGAVVGGGVGAVIGQSIGGRDGAIVGGALGAAAGAAVASDHGHRGYGGAAVFPAPGYPAPAYPVSAYPARVYGPPAVIYPAPPRVVYAPPPRVVYRPVYVAPPAAYVRTRPDHRHWHDRDARHGRYDRYDRGHERQYGPGRYGSY